MPINTKYQAVFKYGSFYHVFNRSVDGIDLFSVDANYIFFLRKFSHYLAEVLDVYAWCLLPNHFHFLVSVKEFEECIFLEKEINRLKDHSTDINGIITQRFKNFFLSYSHSYKRQQNIKTNIFAQHFKHSEIDKDDYFSRLVYYIHLNPLHHKITTDWQQYPWSSYGRIIMRVKSLLKTEQVLEWFGGHEAFIKYHQMQYTDQGSEPW